MAPNSSARLGPGNHSTTRIYAYGEDTNCMSLMPRAPQEGEYEYAANHHATTSEEETHVEPAVLYQPLVAEGSEVAESPGTSGTWIVKETLFWLGVSGQ